MVAQDEPTNIRAKDVKFCTSTSSVVRVNEEDLSETAENGDKWGKAEDGRSRENGKKPRNLSEAASVKFLWELPPPWPESLSSEARKSAEGKFNRRNSTENVPGREDKT